jgi:hypothetical protein
MFSVRVPAILSTATARADRDSRAAHASEVRQFPFPHPALYSSDNVCVLCRTVSCATTLTIVPDKTLAANIQMSGAGVLGQVDSDLSNTPQCSGHGLCKTMREMGNEFNG